MTKAYEVPREVVDKFYIEHNDENPYEPRLNHYAFANAIAAYVQAEWRSIDTAPKDQSILLYTKYCVYVGKFRYGTLGEPNQDELSWRSDCSGRYANPTHWMPMPLPPKGD